MVLLKKHKQGLNWLNFIRGWNMCFVMKMQYINFGINLIERVIYLTLQAVWNQNGKANRYKVFKISYSKLGRRK